MSARSVRRAAERQALKLARKAGIADQPEPASPAQFAANQSNAKLSTGPSPESFPITSQNRTTHGLARHNGEFRLLASEDQLGFAALKQSLFDEHVPTTETESIFVGNMAESHWLSARAQRLQDTCIHPESGVVTDPKMFSLYLRYQTTHTRAFHKNWHDLLKLRAERAKAKIGFEAQQIQKEKHEMKKHTHDFEVFHKDVSSHLKLCEYTTQLLNARRENPDFAAEFVAELSKRGIPLGEKETAVLAVA